PRPTVAGATPWYARAVEHAHRCVHCRVVWLCYDDWPLAGPSACAECREMVLRSPETPWRVVPLRDRRVFDRLAEHAAERIRELLRSRGLSEQVCRSATR